MYAHTYELSPRKYPCDCSWHANLVRSDSAASQQLGPQAMLGNTHASQQKNAITEHCLLSQQPPSATHDGQQLDTFQSPLRDQGGVDEGGHFTHPTDKILSHRRGKEARIVDGRLLRRAMWMLAVMCAR